MSQENPMVENGMQDVGLDDAALETTADQSAEGATLDTVLDDQPESSQQPEQPPKGEKQAGWIQKRIQEGVQKQLQSALAEERSRMAAEYAARLRPLQEAMLDREADRLISAGEFRSKERALEYLRLKSGMPEPQGPEKPAQPARNEKGQFTSHTPDSTEQYGRMLIAQAQAIEAAGGPNVMEAYNADPEVKRRILSREWDFADVARHMAPGAQNPLPTPTRRPNGPGPAARSIHDLSDEQFSRVQKYLERGGVIDMRQR